MQMETAFDQKYLQILLNRLAICKAYRSRFGHGGEGLSLEDFHQVVW